MDSLIRERERHGETSAAERSRYGDGAYDHLVGHWVFAHGARKNWRGIIRRVIYGSDGCQTVLHVHPYYEVDSSRTGNSSIEEEPHNTSEQFPACVLEGGLVNVMLQPECWNKPE